VPAVIITTDTFTQYARRMAATQGCPCIVIADTPHPIRHLESAALLARVEAMLPTVIAGLTTRPTDIERAFRQAARERPGDGAVRSGSRN